MGLILIDGVDHYPTGTITSGFAASGPWTTSAIDNLTTGNPRHPGRQSIFGSVSGEHVQKSFAGGGSTLVAGYAVNWHAHSTIQDPVIQFYDNSGSPVFLGGIYLSSGIGKIEYKDSALNYYHADIPVDPVIQEQQWHYIELKITTGVAGVGAAEIWINGVQWFNDSTNVDNSAGTGVVGGVTFHSTGADAIFTDLYIDYDTRHGDVRVVTLVPESDVGIMEWVKGGTTPSDDDGSNAHHVNKLGPDSDTVDGSYVRIDQAADDVYNMTNLPAGTWDIKGVMLGARALKESSGSPTLGFSVNSGASSTGLVVSDTASLVNSIHDFADDSSAIWTESNVNAMVLTMSYE